jgi:hypothetical protein
MFTKPFATNDREGGIHRQQNNDIILSVFENMANMNSDMRFVCMMKTSRPNTAVEATAGHVSNMKTPAGNSKSVPRLLPHGGFLFCLLRQK